MKEAGVIQMNFDEDFAGPSEWALMYRLHGIQVVPARSYDPKKPFEQWKRPFLSEWKAHQFEMVPDFTFLRWYGSDGEHYQRKNMGMVTGACSGNKCVIDLDIQKTPAAAYWWQGLLQEHNSGIEPETWQQVTGGGGRQLIFAFPEGVVIPTFKTGIGVDIRGQGGFAMLPPSRHQTGNDYDWVKGCGPHDIDVATAPLWLCDAIVALSEEHGGGTVATRERTASAGNVFNDFGQQIEDREDKMFKMIWARLIDLRRDSPIEPTEEDARDAFGVYERSVKSRIDGLGTNADKLEREGRGWSEFRKKWHSTMKKWFGDITEEAAKERLPEPVKANSPEGNVTQRAGIKLFDFAQLILEDVVETPDYIEPDVLGATGFLLIGGPPKAQKSYFLQDLLVTCACGGTMLDGLFKIASPLRVFWLQAEMNEKVLRRRAKAMKNLTPTQIDTLAANLIVSDRFKMVMDENGVRATVELIKSAFMEGETPDIIAFDPMANIFDQENENDNAQVMKFLTQRLEAVRQAINPAAAVILVHHATKKGPDEIRKDPFNCFRGGGSLRGYYDSGIIIFKKDPEGDEREIHFELRGGESPEPMTVKYHEGRFLKVAATPLPEGISAEDLAFIVEETGRRWDKDEPFAIGNQSKRLTLDGFMMQRLNFTRKQAKNTIEKLVGMEAIRPETFDTVRKLTGWKVHKWSR